jgi:hypothetical protein
MRSSICNHLDVDDDVGAGSILRPPYEPQNGKLEGSPADPLDVFLVL